VREEKRRRDGCAREKERDRDRESELGRARMRTSERVRGKVDVEITGVVHIE
jgi:hypothetical protein